MLNRPLHRLVCLLVLAPVFTALLPALAQTIRQGRLFGVIMSAYKRELSQEEALLLVRNVLRKARRGEAILTQAVPSEPKRAQILPAPDRR